MCDGVTLEELGRFAAHLRSCGRSSGTVENYTRHVRAFAAWLGAAPLTRESAARWRD